VPADSLAATAAPKHGKGHVALSHGHGHKIHGPTSHGQHNNVVQQASA
jgi:hypothetical protein